MSYCIRTTEKFDKELKKLDRFTQKLIKAWIVKHLVNSENPRQYGQGLTANRSGQWRYRIGDYRLLCHIDDGKLVILALSVGHRRNVYEK